MTTWSPLVRNLFAEQKHKDIAYITHDEIWANDKYAVFVRYNVKQPSGVDVTWLSIKRHDLEPCNDWREFQFIKNQLCGEEREAIQIYPAESRLVDGSNQYHLWVLPEEYKIPFGFFDGRTVSEIPLPGGGQRGWPTNMRPADMDEQNKSVIEKLQQFQKKK